MNIPKVSSLILTSVLVAACSGGGGGGNNTAQTNLPNSNITISKDDYVKGDLNNIPVEKGGTEVAKLSGYNRQYSFNGALVKNQENDIGEIILDNSVRLGISKLKGAIGGLEGQALAQALTYYWNATKDPTRDIFYFGYETPELNIPKQGIVTYKGNASRYDNISGTVKNIGTSELTADFDVKTIKGELDTDGVRRNISLKETPIIGNGFNGKAVAGENNILFRTVEGQYEGKFYGPNAEEVAGKATFKGEAIVGKLESLNTSFSAEKQ